MAEENQVQQEPQQVTTKNPKKVEVGKRLAAHNCRKREVKKREEQAQVQKSKVNQYYGIGAVIAGIGGLGYYIYRTKQPLHTQPNSPPNHPPQQSSPQTKKFEMD